MNADHPGIVSVRQIKIMELMRTVENLDGDLLAAYHVNEAGECSDDLLIIGSDPYLEEDDEFFEHHGKAFNWEVDLYSVLRVKRNFLDQNVPEGTATLVDAVKYYFMNRAYGRFDRGGER